MDNTVKGLCGHQEGAEKSYSGPHSGTFWSENRRDRQPMARRRKARGEEYAEARSNAEVLRFASRHKAGETDRGRRENSP